MAALEAPKFPTVLSREIVSSVEPNPLRDLPSDQVIWERGMNEYERDSVVNVITWLRSGELQEELDNGQAAVYVIKPHISEYSLFHLLSAHQAEDEVKGVLLGPPVQDSGSVTLQMSSDEVTEFYPEHLNKMIGTRYYLGQRESMTEAELFVGYHTSGLTTVGIARGEEPIIDLIQKRLGESHPTKAFASDLRAGRDLSIRGRVGAPWSSEPIKYPFQNVAHFSENTQAGSHEVEVFAGMLETRLRNFDHARVGNPQKSKPASLSSSS